MPWHPSGPTGPERLRHRRHSRDLCRVAGSRVHLQPRLPAATAGHPNSGGELILLRNAANFDLSQADASRHPRWDHIVNVVDRNGRLIESWEQHNKLFIRPHRVKINPYDPERHVWLADDGAHSIYKITNDGKKLVMTLGEFKVPGDDSRPFGRPTEIAWLPDGTFVVSDGYTNTRVVKFDPNGRFLMAWGMKGNEPIRNQLVGAAVPLAPRKS